jgi:hypothetical protein
MLYLKQKSSAVLFHPFEIIINGPFNLRAENQTLCELQYRGGQSALSSLA